MSQFESSVKTRGIYLVILWLAISIGIKATGFAMSLPFSMIAVSAIFMIVEIVAIIGLWTQKKWGFALTLAIFGMGIGSAMARLETAYIFGSPWAVLTILWWSPWGMSSIIHLILDTVFAVYISTLIFNR